MARAPQPVKDRPDHERAVVVKALRPEDRGLRDPFAEVNALADTAGVVVVKEAADAARELDVDAVIADSDLTPAQERNLEKISERKVIDRSQLILDIFARRARTRQAKLQVELAQLLYSLPRLKRMWGHLSRYEGGIGMRGPGETQLETDKRLIRKRIQRLERELKGIQRRTEASLEQRGTDFVISIVGYTNAGKSTLLNRLTGSHELVEDKLFATLDTRTRRWRIGHNRVVLLGDTVGFIRDLPHHLVASFQATLAEIRHADLLFHVVDASSPDARRQIAAVEAVLHDLDSAEKPTWVLLNKWDALPDDQAVEARTLLDLFPERIRVFTVSAQTGMGLEEIQDAVNGLLDRKNVRVSALVPHQRGDLTAFLCRHGRVERKEYREEGVWMAVELSPARASKFRDLWPEGEIRIEPVSSGG